ncbi:MULTISPECIES: hypothetical protein [unclassified Streptomyces]|uniref:hypothetical protein n=1 Tax=unclassified Streptomyces TaxID=2593676 RepID=UPI0024A9CC0D|nr:MULTISPECIES: hypothetical protein [unclassified Streptomyces]
MVLLGVFVSRLSAVRARLQQHGRALLHLADTDPKLNDALNAVWASGPGSAEPGMMLAAGEPMTRKKPRPWPSTSPASPPLPRAGPAPQPVVNGGACLWNLDWHSCDKFVLSGADLVYWQRKREQWRMVAEGAPTSEAADYLNDLFEPTARAIDGLERALGAVGLLDEALSLDLRRPQDHFGRVWSTVFRAEELAGHGEEADEAA